MKIVIDTNVFFSSFLNPKGTPRQIIDLWKSGRVTLCLCAEILAEYLEVLSRFGLAGEPELRELLDLFKSRQGIDFVVIDNDLHEIEADPADDKFLECALKAHAAFIVSSDKHLKGLQDAVANQRVNQTQIVSSDKHLKGLQVYEGVPILSLYEYMTSLRN